MTKADYSGPELKRWIMFSIMDILFSKQDKGYIRRRNEFIKRNAAIYNQTYPIFKYKGEQYSLRVVPSIMTGELHPSLHQEFDAFLEEFIKLRDEEREPVRNYINQVLNISNNLSDYLKLLPEVVHDPIREAISDDSLNGKGASDKEIKDLLDKNQHIFDLIHMRVMTNLIT